MRSLYSSSFQPPAPVLAITLGTPVGVADVQVMALVDSGADVTVLPRETVANLGLKRVGTVSVSGVGSRSRAETEYSVKVSIVGAEYIIRAITWAEDYALLGRDLLNRVRTVLDGPSRELEVS